MSEFRGVQFNSRADFQDVQFNSRVNFKGAQFNNSADFRQTEFNDLVDFRGARIDSMVDFSLAAIKDTIFVGTENSSDIQRYDFKRAVLLSKGKQIISADTTRGIPEKTLKFPGTKILLYGSVDLKIQLEKFEFIQLCDTLNYYAKKDIISTLKDISFNEDKYKKERFELDYIFAKSTMYQKELPYYERYSISNPTYGVHLLGYRPFSLAYWALGIIIIFALLYFIKMRVQINNYIFKDEKVELLSTKGKKVIKSYRNISNAETIINCLYFSTMLLFTFRLKKDILTFFEMKEKHFIVTEWVFGIIIFIAFLMLAKAGSILHTLKSLLIG